MKLKRKLLTGVAAGAGAGVILAIPAAVVGWGAAVYFGAVLTGGLAVSVGVPKIAGLVVGGLLGASVLGAPAAGAAFYGTLAGMTALGGLASTIYAGGQKAVQSVKNLFKAKPDSKSSEPAVKQSPVSQSSASDLQNRSARSGFAVNGNVASKTTKQAEQKKAQIFKPPQR